MLKVIFFPGFLALKGCEPTPQHILKVGTNLWPGYESLYLAIKNRTLSKSIDTSQLIDDSFLSEK